MRVRIYPGSTLQGTVAAPGDKSIAHRWLILAVTAQGSSRLVELPASLDVRSTARCLAMLAPVAEPALEAWARNDRVAREDDRSTWNGSMAGPGGSSLEVKGEGSRALRSPSSDLDCGNSGTSMRLLMGVLAASPLEATLTGDPSLSRRPMERVAEPLRRMGATVSTTLDHAPIRILGGALMGIDYTTPMASAQVKSAILLAGRAAEGPTTVREPVATRDHTERALTALGATVKTEGTVDNHRALPARRVRGTLPRRSVLGRVPGCRRSLDRFSAHHQGRGPEPDPYAVPGGDVTDGRGDGDARRAP